MRRSSLPVALGVASLLAAPGGAQPAPTLVAAGSRLEVVRLEGTEAISSLFRFQLDLVAESPLPFDAVLGKEVTATLPLPDGTTRHFSGIVSRLSQGHDGGGAFQRAEIVPKLWLLTRTAQSRMFRDASVPEIVRRLLDESGVAHESLLAGAFPKRDCVVQYRETDFAFVSRLLEEEGIYYFFRHDEGGHRLVLADTPQGHPDVGGSVPFFARSQRPGVIHEWSKVQELRSGKVTLRDHTFHFPGEDFEASASIQESAAAGQTTHLLRLPGTEGLELYDYPGEYAQRFDGVDEPARETIEEEARRTAEIRMQEEAARALAVEGAGTAGQLASGHRFTLERHVDFRGSYVVTSVQHRATLRPGGGGGLEYANSFTCIPAGLPFRPVRATPRPTVGGIQEATVAGPSGAETHVDSLGRIKVRFPWDREATGDESSSCWIRVATPHGGGEPTVPRVGEQVIVAFEEGDPDRPIVIGRVPQPAPRP